MQNKVTVSIVSHGQAYLVKMLLDDLNKYCQKNIQVILTINIKENLVVSPDLYQFPITFIYNNNPKGFAENHNNAYSLCNSQYFAVVNPDIRIETNPFTILIQELEASNAALIAPRVLNPNFLIENSVRKFQTPISILKKILFQIKSSEYETEKKIINPDWVAGMFMLFKSEKYKLVNGFDEKYFLYYEDVDICKKLHQLNQNIVYSPSTYVIHAARRASHKNFKYLLMHIKSMLRFFIKWSFNNLRINRSGQKPL